MANRNFVLMKVDKNFSEMLKRQDLLLAKRFGLSKPLGYREITSRITTPDIEKIINLQLSNRRRKLIGI